VDSKYTMVLEYILMLLFQYSSISSCCGSRRRAFEAAGLLPPDGEHQGSAGRGVYIYFLPPWRPRPTPLENRYTTFR
jgi:hypothetical protein